MSPEQRKHLLEVARAAVAARLGGSWPAVSSTRDEALLEPRGAFVSVHVGGELRGCIGVILPERPLVETVASCAVSAATADPRFAPLTAGELPDARFEISVLSRPCRVAAPHEVEIGRHGVIVTRDREKGLLLPQVAVRHGLEREEFLDMACRKAGLHPAAWREPGVTLEVFTAEIFGEEDHPPAAPLSGGPPGRPG